MDPGKVESEMPERDSGNGERHPHGGRPTVLAKFVQAGAPQHGVAVGVDAVRRWADTKALGCT